jgi:alkylation response protein AidB-like acyl-CoA dehydrogenase
MALDFSLRDDQRAMLDSIDKFFVRHLPPEAVRAHDQAHTLPRGLLKGLADLGVLGVPFPEIYGGLGDDWTSVTLIQERLGRHAAIAASIYSVTVDFGGMTLMRSGTEAQRVALLPKLIAGDLQFSLALTEPEAGTDASAIRTSAQRTSSGWRIRGRKTWISSADTAAYLVTPCRTLPGSSGREGVSMLLVPRDAAGIQMTRLPKVGNHSLLSFDIAFEDVEVGEDALLGAEHDGFRALMSTLQYSRSGQAANAIGQAQAAIDMAVRHARERVQFGAPLTQFQVLRHRLVDMQMRVDQARLALYQLAWLLSRGERARLQSAAVKVIASEALQYVSHHGMQILASAGYAAESDMNRYWRDGRLYSFGEGANEAMRDIMAREMGL